MDTWNIKQFEDFLTKQREAILGRISSEFSKEIINLTFDILAVQLKVAFEVESEKFVEAHQEKT